MRKIVVCFLLALCWIPAAHAADDLNSVLLQQSPGLKPEALNAALAAHDHALLQGSVDRQDLLTIIDFSIPSSEKRLWTFDLAQRKLLYHELVAHGRNSGENRTLHFSNAEGSLMTSIGVYRTDAPYIGKNGYSLRLVGLEPGFNSNVYSRAVVLHGAWYVSEKMIQMYGRLGRSYGCPAVRAEIATPLIDTIKNGSLLVAYYPEQDWLQHSAYLKNPQVAQKGF